ncbi:MAG: prephenate dehydrogenase/arogenate dehydrogenase family protein [Desulfohalobiaceae bacterium]|nr:prephenate dehydrogenase/arogenate dehydrogenase family protein [Desulfohalobiaceae bacterium]
MTESDFGGIHSISIIGAKGAMGRFFRERLNRMGYLVRALDRPLPEDSLLQAGLNSNLVLLAVPIRAMEDVLQDIKRHLPTGSILADICSVKIRPLQLMLGSHPGPVVGLHPLFGPDADASRPLKVALVPGRDRQAGNEVRDLLSSTGFRPFETSAEEHDQAMALIQGLNFVTTVSYLSAASESPGLEKFLTPSFERRLQAASKMLTEDGELFQDLFEINPFSQDAVRSYRSYLNLAAAGELDLLNDKACWWWSVEKEEGG